MLLAQGAERDRNIWLALDPKLRERERLQQIAESQLQQIESNLKAATLTLAAEDVARLDKVSEPSLLYPYWHQAYTASDRAGEADLTLLKPYLGRDLTVPRP